MCIIFAADNDVVTQSVDQRNENSLCPQSDTGTSHSIYKVIIHVDKARTELCIR